MLGSTGTSPIDGAAAIYSTFQMGVSRTPENYVHMRHKAQYEWTMKNNFIIKYNGIWKRLHDI